MRDGLADEGVGVRHSAVILGCREETSQQRAADSGGLWDLLVNAGSPVWSRF
jgi:hypothetical protein